MILGVGTDLCDVHRIAQAIGRFGDRFTRAVFTDGERRACEAVGDRAARYACAFAAKEACAKALGVGIETLIRWHDVEIVAEDGRRPRLRLAPAAEACAAARLPPGHAAALHLALARTGAAAQAFVIFEAMEPGGPR